MSRQTLKLQIFFREVNFQFTKAYNIPDTRSIQSLLRLTDTVDVGGVNGTIQHFCQKMKSHLPSPKQRQMADVSQISKYSIINI
jgi:hypothetical protein